MSPALVATGPHTPRSPTSLFLPGRPPWQGHGAQRTSSAVPQSRRKPSRNPPAHSPVHTRAGAVQLLHPMSLAPGQPFSRHTHGIRWLASVLTHTPPAGLSRTVTRASSLPRINTSTCTDRHKSLKSCTLTTGHAWYASWMGMGTSNEANVVAPVASLELLDLDSPKPGKAGRPARLDMDGAFFGASTRNRSERTSR